MNRVTPPAVVETRSSKAETAGVEDVIDEIFAQFDVLYPSAFQRAFAEPAKLKAVKRLWLRHLRDQPPKRLMRALHKLVRDSRYLPTLHEMLERCRDECKLPSPRLAWRMAREAAPYGPWEHAAIYHAARATGMETLMEQGGAGYEIFSRNYQIIQRRVMAGEKFEMPSPGLPPPPSLDPKQALEQVRGILDSLK